MNGVALEMILSGVMATVTGVDGPGPEFERIGVENGGFWYARQLMELLGYENYNNFQKAIGRAISTFTTLEIPRNRPELR
jgi:hypothetical protein